MGRPKHIAEAKLHPFVVRLTDTQHAIIQKYADQLGVSMAEYIRHMAIHGKVEISYHFNASLPELQKLTREFSAIGNNLNQIAKYFHMGGTRSRAMQEEINSCIEQLYALSEEVMKMAGEYNGNSKTSIK